MFRDSKARIFRIQLQPALIIMHYWYAMLLNLIKKKEVRYKYLVDDKYRESYIIIKLKNNRSVDFD